ncbi:hypothetical protein LUZ61_008874 [Rhynchospora tenuis]|uniref:F-box domain-containing protein n=1 Tax=Rhynchospora tenuis TaxID=198213 RepID=A0AAD5ZW60_9POAL|nr:hypothetical protein LUZ61_008874 [Rhynchospora tenuis]
MADFELNSDFLSSMPSDIITKILVNLPIKEAVRTSTLSSKWKYSWTSIPDLVFIKDTTDSELVRSVDKVLLVHQGPILKFKIDCDKPREEAINRWLPILGHGLKDLCLWFDCFAGRKVHLSLLSCLKLEHLKLLGCIVYAPQCFQGFKLLQNLKMYACDLVGITIEEFVSSCPMLESLACCDNGVHRICLAICAPNLKQLELVGAFANLSLETPRLVCASIFLDTEIGSSYIATYDYQFSNPTSGVCKRKI